MTEPLPTDLPASCLNCGAELMGSYCAHCGQKGDIHIPTLREFFGDILDSMYNLDSRVWRTLKPLLISPGKLTNEFFAGRRAAYLPPFRLYLVLSLIFFLVPTLASNGGNVTVTVGEDCQQEVPRILQDSWIGAKLIAACELANVEGNTWLVESYINNIPLMMLLWIPILGALFKLFYLRSGRRYVEHLMFVIHFQALFFLMLIAHTLVSYLGLWFEGIFFVTLFFLVMPYVAVYLFLALRRVYRQSWPWTALKYGLVLGGYLLTLYLMMGIVWIYTALTL